MQKRNIVKKYHTLVNSKYNHKSSEMKFILLCITRIKMEDQLFPDIEFTVKELQERLGVAQNHTRIRSEMKRFKSLTFEMPVYNDEGKLEKYIYRSWFEEIEYHIKDGRITAKFDSKIKPMLLQIKERITKYDINFILQMKSSYSIRIYELLKEYQRIGHRTYEVKELMDILSVPKALKTYSNFKKRVLLQAESELNEFADIAFDLEEIKQGRAVAKLRFNIKKNIPKVKPKNKIVEADVVEKIDIKDMDYKQFISYIRENYIYSDIVQTNDPSSGVSILLSVNDKGLLYNKHNLRSRYNASKAEALWKYLFSIKTDIPDPEPKEVRQKQKGILPDGINIFDLYEDESEIVVKPKIKDDKPF